MRVRVTEGKIAVMYDGNPGEIDFGSSLREVRVSEGSSYRESTVITPNPVWHSHRCIDKAQSANLSGSI